MAALDDIPDAFGGDLDALLISHLEKVLELSAGRLADLRSGIVDMTKQECARERRMLHRALDDNLDSREHLNLRRKQGMGDSNQQDMLEALLVRTEMVIREQMEEVDRLEKTAPDETPWTVQFEGAYAMDAVEQGLDTFLRYDESMEQALAGAEGDPVPVLSQMDLDQIEDDYTTREKAYALIGEQLNRWRKDGLTATQELRLGTLDEKLRTLRDNARRMLPLIEKTRSFTQEGVVGLVKSGGMDALMKYVQGAAKKKR
jgi:hypothetical protein